MAGLNVVVGTHAEGFVGRFGPTPANGCLEPTLSGQPVGTGERLIPYEKLTLETRLRDPN